ncbi:MCM OB domain protein [uncultured archaeon]|nr:MCM OB domain protein [uncultured archaeon]
MQQKLTGTIQKVNPINSRLIEGVFSCQYCGELTIIKQDESLEKITEPFECGNDVCGRKNCFKLIVDRSTFVEEASFVLLVDNVPIVVHVRGRELINKIPIVGSMITVSGNETYRRNSAKSKSNIFNKIVIADEIIEIGQNDRFMEPLNIISSSRSIRERLKVLRNIIKELQQKEKGGVKVELIISKAEEAGIRKETIEDMLMKLRSAGEIIEREENCYRVV